MLPQPIGALRPREGTALAWLAALDQIGAELERGGEGNAV
jgi:hypothetical protein